MNGSLEKLGRNDRWMMPNWVHLTRTLSLFCVGRSCQKNSLEKSDPAFLKHAHLFFSAENKGGFVRLLKGLNEGLFTKNVSPFKKDGLGGSSVEEVSKY